MPFDIPRKPGHLILCDPLEQLDGDPRGSERRGYVDRQLRSACADGRFDGYPVTLKLSSPGRLGGHLVFTRLKFTFTRRTAPGYRHSETWSADEFDHIYGWGQ